MASFDGHSDICYKASGMIKVITEISEFAALQKDWDSLMEGSGNKCIYNQPDILKIWWNHFGQVINDENERPFILRRGLEIIGEVSRVESLHVIVLKHGSALIGIFPLMRVCMRPRGSKKFIYCLTFIGDSIFVPTPTIAIRLGCEYEAMSQLKVYLESMQEWDAVFLAPLRDDDKSMNALIGFFDYNSSVGRLKDAVHSSFHDVEAIDTLQGCQQSYMYQVCSLPSDFEAFLKSCNQRLRRIYRKYLKDLDARNYSLVWSFEEILSPHDFLEFYNLHGLNYSHSVHFNKKTTEYYAELLDFLERKKNLRWIVARDCGQVRYAMLQYSYGNTISYIALARDKNYSQYNLGNLGLLLAIKRSIEEGRTFFDFRIGSEPYKKDFRPTEIPYKA
ncbi:MAG: GNAT family N-acetyltransferase, partial [Candidatus Uhrbacteria bacterium]|nr:GNAT family N-acetyltransferase [Candidatus Uhrbacteria bacterium]